MTARPLPAGPATPTPGAQMLGETTVRYALCRSGRNPYSVVEDAFLPLLVTPAAGGDPGPDHGSALEVDGAEVSAVRRRDGRLEVRVFNASDSGTTVTVAGRTGWLIDLRGRALEQFDGTFELRPWGIATAAID